MSYQIRFTRAAKKDLLRLYGFLLKRDPESAKRARVAIEKGIGLLRDFPFTCRKATPDDPFLRELVIQFGSAGYIALFEIEGSEMLTILAVRHQREDDYH
ncbi:MAG: type II toxin-antitoxin system RelE/ParE family toxin [Sulfuricellaceae bacterium]|nr:type II toxin-antitoxin system RelE/ParE family toxin [Sulfuricellaceae bacterium]